MLVGTRSSTYKLKRCCVLVGQMKTALLEIRGESNEARALLLTFAR